MSIVLSSISNYCFKLQYVSKYVICIHGSLVQLGSAIGVSSVTQCQGVTSIAHLEALATTL